MIHLHNLKEKGNITNADLITELTNFSNVYSKSNFDKIISIIEESIQNIKRNIYAPLLLTTLALRMKETLTKNKN